MSATNSADATRSSVPELAPVKLLYLTEEVPNRDPLHGDGSSMISYEVLRHLPADVVVHLVTFKGAAAVPPEIRNRSRSITELRQRRPQAAAVLSVLSGMSVGAAARSTRRARATVRRISAECDVTLVHGPHVADLCHQVLGPLVVQVVDPWSLRVGMEIGLSKGIRAWYRRRKAAQALTAERALPRRARLITVGEADAEAWSTQLSRRVRSLANGMDTTNCHWHPPVTPTVSFVGSLGYQPNVESAEILVHQLAPRIWRRVPNARFIIAGRQPTPAVLALASDLVEIRPNVPSVEDVYAASSVAVFADRHGVGVRNSVREALACGAPVVASIAAAREQPSHPLLHVAHDEDDLVELVIAALRAPSPGPKVPADASRCETSTRTWQVVAEDYLAICREAISGLNCHPIN